jgi:magnesium chelatase family protein
VIHISRAARQSTFPAQFQLVAAMNPCPCGWLGHASGRCACTPDRVARYRWRVSGPLLDRIDIAIDVPAVLAESLALNVTHSVAHSVANSRVQRGDACDVAVAEPEIRTRETRESSVTVRSRVERARGRQRDRQGKPNARLLASEVSVHCVPEAAAEDLLAQAMAKLALSARAYHRILKVARTIADLAACEGINVTHVAEAIGYRRFDNA